MSREWVFSDIDGAVLGLTPSTFPGGQGVFIKTLRGEGVHARPEEAVGIAGNLIAFSRAEATMVHGKLPEASIEEIVKGQLSVVVRDTGDSGAYLSWDLKKEYAAQARQIARGTLAIANRIEEYFDSEEHATKVLQERRDKIAEEIHIVGSTYSGLTPVSQRAVDRILYLEDQLSKDEPTEDMGQ
jgi:hypothetical protein